MRTACAIRLIHLAYCFVVAVLSRPMDLRDWHFLGQAAPDVAVPLSTEWAPALLLTILWLFVAAAIAGPVLFYLKLNGRALPRERHASSSQ